MYPVTWWFNTAAGFLFSLFFFLAGRISHSSLDSVYIFIYKNQHLPPSAPSLLRGPRISNTFTGTGAKVSKLGYLVPSNAKYAFTLAAGLGRFVPADF
ncbi:hypothetical protein B0T26DRAFT_511899 [Lasiosphaeria miniovina]|uniref:Uncharacterized protein n=1 Tax=Lasiosphaeria miniovina TaxID=1954250 RepID=A0AA40DJL0_9PEZI|nr:uncharacterized protein B0T26DRAFT_511899 [Lasiosphaeria miniovina]KAK0703776.1 hypothetical protein B0T26DRAFT_511899 [Lasiosphaeria miniovina]